MSDTYDLNRAQHEAENVDALGKKWVIHANRQNGLCYVRPEPDRSDAVIPQNMQGLWTKPSLLQEQVSKYVVDTWDVAEKAKADAERKAQAAKENAAKKVTKKTSK